MWLEIQIWEKEGGLLWRDGVRYRPWDILHKTLGENTFECLQRTRKIRKNAHMDHRNGSDVSIQYNRLPQRETARKIPKSVWCKKRLGDASHFKHINTWFDYYGIMDRCHCLSLFFLDLKIHKSILDIYFCPFWEYLLENLEKTRVHYIV